jgi:hypothetical protein
MMHHNRIWCVSVVESAEELARKLTEHTWTLCTGFAVAGHEDYQFLNDATCEDGAGEYGVVKGGFNAAGHVQIESITFSWCDYERALAHIRSALAGEYDREAWACPVVVQIERPDEHGRCPLCA